MLHVPSDGVHDLPCDPGPPPFRLSGFPDDLNAAMAYFLSNEPPVTEADVDRMWAEEQALRDIERELSVELDNAIRLNRTVSQLLAAEFPGLVAPGSAA